MGSVGAAQRKRAGGLLLVAAVGAASVSVVAGFRAAAAQAETTIWQGVYTEEQSRRGEQAYRTSCSYCHRDDLTGGFFDGGTGRAPALAGSRAFDSSFSDRWSGQNVGEMLGTIVATMPQQQPASLNLQTYLEIVSYLLMKNDVPPGDTALPTDIDALRRILITPKRDP